MQPLPDRQSFHAALEAAIASADERRRPVGVVMAQWVRPVAVRGVPDGDKSAEASTIGEIARTSAVDAIAAVCSGKGDAYPLAEDRWAVVLPNFDLGEATAVAERCMRTFRINALESGSTLFVAAAAYPDPASTSEALIADAERELHQVRRMAIDAAEARTAATAGTGAYPTATPALPSAFTGAQLEHMRLSYIQHRVVTCPNDGTFLRAQEVHEIGRARPTVIVRCPRCGLQARL